MKVYVLPKESGGRPYEVVNEPLEIYESDEDYWREER